MGPDAMILVYWMLSIKPTFSLSSFTFIKRLFNSSLSAIRMVSSVYLRSLILLQAILIPACASSGPAFLMMYSAYKLNKQGDNIKFLVGVPITNSQKLVQWIDKKLEGYSRPEKHYAPSQHKYDLHHFHTRAGYKFYSSSCRL